MMIMFGSRVPARHRPRPACAVPYAAPRHDITRLFVRRRVGGKVGGMKGQ